MLDTLTSQPEVFNFNGHQIRTIITDGNPMWVAADVAKILGHARATDMTKYLDQDEKGVINYHTPKAWTWDCSKSRKPWSPTVMGTPLSTKPPRSPEKASSISLTAS